jgi:hypothetical protein
VANVYADAGPRAHEGLGDSGGVARVRARAGPVGPGEAAKGVQQLTVESKPRESAPVGEKRPRKTRKERRQRGKEQEKGQAYAVTAPVAANKPPFSGNCHNCGKPGHMKVNCTEKKPAGSGQKPGAVCNFCKKVDSRT